LDLLGFALAVLLIELTPGPNMAWLAGLAATEGRRSGLAAVAGVALGLLANGLLAALGLAALLQAAPQYWIWLRVGGAVMMLWLAITTWRSAGEAPAVRAPANSAWRALGTGTVINLLNPKAYIFFVVVAPQFMDDATLTLGAAMILSVVSAAIATAIHLAIVIAGASAHAWLLDPARLKPVKRGFALVMLAIAVSFLVADL